MVTWLRKMQLIRSEAYPFPLNINRRRMASYHVFNRPPPLASTDLNMQTLLHSGCSRGGSLACR